MSHIRYTIRRSGTFYNNRRVHTHAVAGYGTHIRQALSSCPKEAEAYATRLSSVLEASWAPHNTTTPINIPAVVFRPTKPRTLQHRPKASAIRRTTGLG